jgi:rod shape-determining protein MreD
VRFLIALYLFWVGLLALLAQMILPAHFQLLSQIGLGSALVPLVVIYASLELGDERAPILAALLGLILDLLSSPAHRLGTAVLLLSALSALIVTQAYRPESHQWHFRLTYVLVGTFGFITANYFLLQLEAGRWSWPLAVWSQITFASLFNLVVFPFFFYGVGWFPRQAGWRPAYELNERSYAD